MEGYMNNDSKVWLNGNLIPWSEATVPLLSHGFSRGSAFFEKAFQPFFSIFLHIPLYAIRTYAKCFDDIYLLTIAIYI